MTIITNKEFFYEMFEKCVNTTMVNVQQEVVDLLPKQLIYHLPAFGQNKKKLLPNELIDFIYKDGSFPRIVDIAIRGIDDNHTLIWVRPSGHAFVHDFSQTWNTPTGMGPFKSIGLMLPNGIWKRPKPYSLQDLIDAGKKEYKR
jgi:hypothetical protein